MTRNPLTDPFNRTITYLRLSVTDRCDLRCRYCMAAEMTFLPKREILTLEELEALAGAFIARGVRKIRLTGGEPLVRRDVMTLFARLGARVASGELDELALTTNGTQLAAHASALRDANVRRVNISLDTLDAEKFARLTRRDALEKVLEGIEAAERAGLRVKINVVVLKDVNDLEIPSIIEWAHGRGIDVTLIEVMPLGEIDDDRADQYTPLTKVRTSLGMRWTLDPVEHRTGGPARYVRVKETGGLLGFITPLTENFCAGCNRVRVTCTGRLYSCLGHGGYFDLRAALRSESPDDAVNAALDRAMIAKPERHAFDISERGQAPAVARHMSVTGG